MQIFKKDQVIYNRADIIILNRTKQYIYKNIITKFIFGLKILDFCLHMTEYRAYKAKAIYSFFGIFKKTKAYIDMLNTKAQM